jgi:hypothetical protein
VQGVQKHLGHFEDEEAAARAYNKAAIERGCLNQLNFDDYDLPETASALPALQQGSSRSWGVSWDARLTKWRAYVYVQGVQKRLGCFDRKEAAARAYNKAVIERGRLDKLNFDDYAELHETAVAPSGSPAPQQGSSRSQGVSCHASSKQLRAQMIVQACVPKHRRSYGQEEAMMRACDKAAIEGGLLDALLNFDYKPLSLESDESGELVGCQEKCWVDPDGWCPGVLSDYITKGKCKDHYKVRLGCIYVRT